MRDLFAPERRAFSGFGLLRTLRAIEPDDWRDGLRARFAADDCDIEAGALDRLVELGEGHPRATMLIAQQAHLASVLAGTRHIDSALVDLGLQAALQGDEAALEETVTRLRSLHRIALTMARRVAAGDTLHSGIHPGEGDRALKALRDAGIVERRGRGNWVVINPLLRRYLTSG
jgi:DNA-binding transcriptional ArsR family regulator